MLTSVEPDLVSETQALLCGRFGRAIRHLPETDSTNSEALRWLADESGPAPDGAVVVADAQTAGRGRWGRTWVAGTDTSLMFSLVLRPSLPPERLELLTTLIGVATVEAVRELTGIDALLKWPNDVVIGDRKLAGILVESQSRSGRIETVIAGVGVNLDLGGVELPDDVAARAVSLSEVSSEVPSRPRLLASILSWAEPLYDNLWTDAGPPEIMALASKRSAVLGAEVSLRLPDGSEFVGTANRLLADGSLVVSSGDEERSVRSGEISSLRHA